MLIKLIKDTEHHAYVRQYGSDGDKSKDAFILSGTKGEVLRKLIEYINAEW